MTAHKTWRVGVAGLGTVGGGLIKFLAERPAYAPVGDYAQVTFQLTAPQTTTRVPVTALQYREQGPVVAVVGPDSHVTIRKVVINRDLGSSVEIGAGLSGADRVVDNPPESLANGDLVRIAGASVQQQKAGA